MPKHAKLIGAVALGAAAVVTFAVIQTAGKPPSAGRPPTAIGADDFAGQVSPADSVSVTCAAGETTGAAEVQVQVNRTSLGGESGGNFGPGGRVVVTWPGSDRPTSINSFDRNYQVGGSRVPCPETEGVGVPTTFTFQLYKGPNLIGTDTVTVTFFRVGSAS